MYASAGKLRAVPTPEPADAYIVAVPTPFMDDHKPDLSYIRSAAEALAPTLRGGELVILESTSPPGTTQRMADWILAQRPDLSLDGSDGRPRIYVAHCPERVLPGKIMVELVTNDRIVGGITPEAAQRSRDLYQVFCQGEILLTDAATAEAAKLVENSFRDVNIAFANELSLVADRLGIDVWELIRLANHHPRVNILQPGPGVGGHCIAVGDGSRGERREAPLGAGQGARRRRRGRGPGRRRLRAGVQAEHRRPARVAGRRDRA
jgi:UDP-N-acetyl-D-mannosaminuronic acid dehydrogenase